MTAALDSASQNRVTGGHGLAPSPVRNFLNRHEGSVPAGGQKQAAHRERGIRHNL